MFVGITNVPRDYPWGSSTAIAKLLGRQPSGGPEAELWFGAHPGAPSQLVAADSGAGGAGTLDRLIATDPAAALGPGREHLPFLLKVLSAAHPLSLQAHPDPEQAKAGFARETDAGIPLGDPARNYGDASAKPEIILALSLQFEALAGFRHVSESRVLLAELAGTAPADDRAEIDRFAAMLAAGDPAQTASVGSSRDVHRDGMPEDGATSPAAGTEDNSLRTVVGWLLERGDGVDRLVSAITDAAARVPDASGFGREWATVDALAEQYPGDPGIVISLLLNRVTLTQGQAMYLDAGVLHAYLSGTGVELMAPSDNTLRGGLTSKHVDVAELLRVVDFRAAATPVITPDSPVPGVDVFRTNREDFVLARVELGEVGSIHGYQARGPESAAFLLTGPAIALCISGGVTVRGGHHDHQLGRGDAVFISPDEGSITFTGSGCVFVATTP